MDDMRDLEIRVLREVIEAVEGMLDEVEAAGGVVGMPRSEVYAIVIQAVIASARAGGHYGFGSLVRAPLLDAILAGVDVEPWDEAVFTVLMGQLTSR
ncbi:hypothetical protein [Nocardia sp. NPDC020380]|uniref:hypothetical protein n=1 Tax=Nocardia sp. NPDC020380 TaxID=3364309 RepID=UPI0037BC14F3